MKKPPKKKAILWRGELHQGGICVAIVEHSNPKIVRREIMHYVAQYAQDGPVIVKEPWVVK